MRNPDQKSKKEGVEGGRNSEGKGPLWAYQTAQECGGKNELGSLAQDGPCDWV